MGWKIGTNKDLIDSNTAQLAEIATTFGELTASSATDVITLKTDFNALVAKLASIGIVIPPEEVAYILGTFDIYNPPLASNEWVTDAGGKTLNITDSQFLALFYDPYVGTQADGMVVTKTSLGKDQSGLYDIYEYDFKPTNYTETILLSGGMHAYELPASFGLAHFIKHMMETPYLHNGFKYLRENVRVKVIGIMNPWGFNQSPKKYGNSNGVNINRNFDYDGAWASFPVYSANPADGNYNEWNVKGTAPFSEAETIIHRDWGIANSIAKFWIDCHTGVNNSTDHKIWLFGLSNDPLLSLIYGSIQRQKTRMRTLYGYENPLTTFVLDDPTAIAHKYTLNSTGIPYTSNELTNSWDTALNNEGADIMEYEASLAARIFTYLSKAPSIYSSSISQTINDTTPFSITYNITDISSTTFTAKYSVDGVITTVNDLSLGSNVASFGTLAEGTRTVEIYVIDEVGYESNKITLTIVVTGASASVVVADTFTRADSSTIGSTEIGNKLYTLGVDSGYSIVSNSLKSTNTFVNNQLFFDPNLSNFDFNVDIKWYGYAGMEFRYVSSTSTFLVRVNSTSLILAKQPNSPTAVIIGTYNFTPVAGTIYNLRVVASGSNITVYLDGVSRITATDSLNSTQTMMALKTSNDTQSSFDNLEIIAL